MTRKRGLNALEEMDGGYHEARGEELQKALIQHLDDIQNANFFTDKRLEMFLLEDKKVSIENDRSHIAYEKGLITFSPSGADKCDRELYYKAMNSPKDKQLFLPYQGRWTRNGSAVHEYTQRDLLYGEKLKDPKFKVARTKRNGLPAWEHNIFHNRVIEHKGVRFQLNGMMDGILTYQKDDSKVGFEFKTKSTTVAAIGDFLLSRPQESHYLQCVAYSLLFGLDEYLLTYETLAKDGWMKGEEARYDTKCFYLRITDEDREALLDKFARIATHYYERDVPPYDLTKWLFTPYRNKLSIDEGISVEEVNAMVAEATSRKFKKKSTKKKKAEDK